MLAAEIIAEGDYTGFSFFIASMAMLAATVFFFAERGNVAAKWRLSVTVSALITGIAAVHYYYMRGVWVGAEVSPTSLRYIDWTLTVPLMCVEFYLILRAVQKVSIGILNRLLLGSIVMLVFGYLGEARIMNEHLGFAIGMAGWGLVMYEVFAGEASKVSAAGANASLQGAFKALRNFALFGWAIYPIGYYAGAAGGASWLDITYNLADVVNKVGFGLVIYALARKQTVAEQQGELATANAS
jgi:bacteriorhodopsin